MNLSILDDNYTVVTMSSLELVQFINNQRDVFAPELAHSDFLKKVLQVLGPDAGLFSSVYLGGNGQERPCYNFPKREACLMAMSYSYDLQAKVFDRMTALEAKQPAPAALSTMDILTLAIESERGRLLAVEQRDQAIATKAQIGDKKTATAMATASHLKRENNKLKDELGFSARHATILQVEDSLGGDFDFVPLRRWCKANEVVPQTVPDKRYPNGVKAWPAGAWAAVYSVDLVELFGGVAA